MVHTARLVSVLTLLATCSANDDIHNPAVAAVTPDRSGPGTTVLVTGSYFCQQPEAEEGEEVDPLACEHVGDVLFGANSGNAVMYTDSMILVEIPRLAPGQLQLRVVVEARISNRIDFTVE